MSQPLPRPDDALLRLARAVQETGYHFTTPAPATHARVNARPHNAWARDLRDVFGWSRPFRPDILPPGLFALMQEADIAEPHGDGWRSLMRLSTLSGLLFLHSAYPTTSADSVFFGPDTYRFARTIASHLERRAPPVHRAVDVGCGAGPGAVLLARDLPGAEILAVDINPAALRLTRVNAVLAGVQVHTCHSDLLTQVHGLFDLIIANPPYLVDPAARAYRHGGGSLGANLSLDIVRAACDRLAPGGTLLLYTGAAVVNGDDPFRAAATAQLEAAGLGWAYEEVDPDVFGEELAEGAYRCADRIAAVVLTANKTR
ncbi:MAG: class I SAM-dependent methyltransferase [Acetobacteraceae bacterium]|nr:class I SAM-dependent methyltransferase [Acetobacteraceae bacterium]